jgi:hypothetical protein
VRLAEHEILVDQAVAHVSLLELEQRSDNGGPAVAVLRWPDHHDRVEELRQTGQARLLILGPDDDPVTTADGLEDWLRLPADDRDVRMRLLRLRDRATRLPAFPVLDGCGRLVFAGGWVGLSGVEERLACPLVEHFEQVVSYAVLLEAGWPGQHKDKVILRPRITGLRRRVATIGLELRSIRDVGHLLEASDRRS